MDFPNPVMELPYTDFFPDVDETTSRLLAAHLESGGVLYLPGLGFPLEKSEQRFLSTEWSNGKTKNIYLQGNERILRGAQGDAASLDALTQLIERYSQKAYGLIEHLFPDYAPYAKAANTSLRCFEAAGRKSSWRKDDRRLHPDAFPSKPTHGERILRVFTNVNPQGRPRTWKIGEPFVDMARKFLPRVPAYSATQAKLLKLLGITKTLRGEYDHIMLHLHDLVKADMDYQKNAPQLTFDFPPNSTWIVYSDQVLHAVLSGQFMMEQTFHLPPDRLYNPNTSPLATLQTLLGRPLR